MSKNQNTIIEHLSQIREDTAGIKSHLKDLNGKVARNIKDIEINRKSIKQQEDDDRNRFDNLTKENSEIKIKIAKYIGIGMGIIGLSQFLIQFI